MLFPRVDVKECLLRNSSGMRMSGRYVERIEIDMTSARSQKALTHLERAKNQADRYMVEQARRFYCDASECARREKDGFVEAAAVMSLALLMDGTVNGSSQPHYLGQALEALDFELYGLRQQMLTDRTPREVALPIMTPRVALRDLIEENQRQFQFRQDSLLLAETKTNIDRHLAAGRWVEAANVARIGSQNVTEMYGKDHWWNAVMLLRLGTALLRQQEVAKAQQAVAHVGSILDEWTDYADTGVDVFKFERDMLSVARNDIALMLA